MEEEGKRMKKLGQMQSRKKKRKQKRKGFIEKTFGDL